MLTKTTFFSVIWSFLEQFMRRGISVAVTLVLAYFLTPEDYSLIAMVMLFLAVGNAFIESGFKQALIRRVELEERYTSSAFYASLVIATVAWTGLFFFSPYIAAYYQNENLIPVLKVVGLLFILNAFHVVPTAILSKKLQFKILLKASVPAAFISGLLAIVLAYMGAGIWAIIAQVLLSAFITAICLVWYCDWKPRLIFSFEALKEMYSYGYKLLLSHLLDAFYKNTFVVVIAKTLTAGIAGLYFFADRIRELLVFQLITSIQKVLFPALSNIQEDTNRTISAYRKIMQVMAFLIFPTLLIFVALAQLLFEIALPEKWLPSVPYLQLMCVASLVIPISSVNINVLKLQGKSDWFLLVEFVKTLSSFITLYFTIDYGVEIILIAQIIVLFANYLPLVYLANKLICYPIFEQVRDFFPALLLSIVVAICIAWLESILVFFPVGKLIVLSLFALVLYAGLAYIFKLRSLFTTLNVIKSIRNKTN